MTELNRFDYFSDIEDTFVRLRGKALNISPLDWALIESWKNAGVPLHVVTRAIEAVFANHKAKARTRPIKSLSYCKDEVDAQYKEYLEGRVGAHEESVPGAVATGSNDPFPKEKVLAHLEKCRQSLIDSTVQNVRTSLEVALTYARADLISMTADFAAAPIVRVLEERLIAIERNLDVAIESVATPEQIAEARAAAEAIFSPYKNSMLPQVFEQQIDNLLKKYLREIFGVPRLSLFHMRG
jgi:hypothetical protein